MSLVKKIYEIFEKTSDSKERLKEIEEVYNKEYAIENSEIDRNWKFSLPILEEMVNLDFKINILVECRSQSHSCSAGNVFVHLEDKLNHNKELITLLLAIEKIWNIKEISYYYDFHCRALYAGGAIENFIEKNNDSFKYAGNLLNDIKQACKWNAPDIKKELIDEYWYHYLCIDLIDKRENTCNTGCGTKVELKKVIIW